jgi:hypothetical protein
MDEMLLLPLLKKEIVAAGGWGVTEYLQLDWMDDRTNGWMMTKRMGRIKGKLHFIPTSFTIYDLAKSDNIQNVKAEK